MTVDDRLDTVLRTSAAGGPARNTQLRQLVDLLGRTRDDAWGDAHTRALARIDALHGALGDAATGTLIALTTPRSPKLIAHLVELGPRAAQAAIAHARLDEPAWLGLVPALPIHARGLMRHRRDLSPAVIGLLERLGVDDFVLPGPIIAEPPKAAEPVPRPAEAATVRDGIGAIVRRIEAFRRTRDGEDRDDPRAPLPHGQAHLPFGERGAAPAPALRIDLRLDAAGVVIAADGVNPATLVGHAPITADSADRATCAALTLGRPIEAGRITLHGAPAIAGSWRIDAVPLFGEDGGRFTGYRARLQRPPQRPELVRDAPAPSSDTAPEVLHQMLHELRTPINAIQGFAELIQQQMLGPTPHQYRSLAASIAADAARMLAGFEDVERLIRLETGRSAIEPGETDLAALTDRLVAQLGPLTGPREIRLRWTPLPVSIPVMLAQDEAERTLWRLLSTLVSAAAPGERLMLSLGAQASMARLTMTLPQALALREDEALFAPDIGRGAAPAGGGMLGHGFALRLSGAEIRAAGGSIARPGPEGSAVLEVSIPLAHSHTLDHDAIAS